MGDTGEPGNSSAVGGRPEGRAAQRRETEGSRAGEGRGGRLGTRVPAGSRALVGLSRRGARPETGSAVRVGCGGGRGSRGPRPPGPGGSAGMRGAHSSPAGRPAPA